MDRISKPERSALMAKVRTKNTAPEVLVRRLLHRAGFRFRCHYRNLPGSPDIILPKYRAIIFVHGCFWHGHKCKRGALPSSNKQFWEKKISRNRARDLKNLRALRRMGYHVTIVWACRLQKPESEMQRLFAFLNRVGTSIPSTKKELI
jgi:DNA mismatch endonuclease (patch repair protein)